MASYVQIPPDSTGKKIRSTSRIDFQFDGQTGTIQVGNTITGVTSGTFVGSIFGGPGLTVSATDGAFILPPKHAVSIQISTPEDGTLNISYQGYFEELQ